MTRVTIQLELDLIERPWPYQLASAGEILMFLTPQVPAVVTDEFGQPLAQLARAAIVKDEAAA